MAARESAKKSLGNKWAVISSHYVNAWGLADLILDTGWNGRLVCLRRPRDPAVLMRLYNRGVEVWDRPSDTDLVGFLAHRIPAGDKKWLFFTEELSLQEVFAATGHDDWLAHATWRPGRDCLLRVILDRFAFYDLIERKGIGRVPKTIPGDSDPFAQFGNRFFFRYRETWVKGNKTPRIRLIENRNGFEEMRRSGEAKGYGPPDWCFQEVLSLAPEDNVSVCGWHEKNSFRYAATHKVLQFPKKQGNGDVCETLPLSPELSEVTRNLLDELQFAGPFELEFIRDGKSGHYYLIELNPRFWMQHPLAGGALNQALVRRYLGLADEPASEKPVPRYWVNTVVALNRLARADFRGWKYLRHAEAIRVPPLSVTFRWLPFFAVNLLFRQLRRR